ncbi:hypothetical protein CC86DRAFT_432790 [Ophiobolus disseminans]|uniref:Uncharacterized protein n=1 Tax=Ophiobolus disseminans TaxID=1469910 RepID=A0A6A6ZEJ7_9PLEO|nr:hypothetical protein CC86DRAFT_432790 [Ophiobolus disseminans]
MGENLTFSCDGGDCKWPDLSCPVDYDFYACPDGGFWGCCKIDACKLSCSVGDIGPAFADRPDLMSAYGDLSINHVGAVPLTTVTPKRASGPASLSPQSLDSTKIGRSDALKLTGASITIMAAICARIGLWLCYRRLIVRLNERLESSEREHLPAMTEESTKNGTQTICQNSNNDHVVHDVRRLGTNTIYMLLATTLVIAGVCSLVAFLWFADSRSAVWHRIMMNGWATRSVALSALILRTAVDLQAAIASAILASLLIESKSGAHLYQLAKISPIRSGTTSPWTLASSLLEHFTQWSSRYRWNYHICIMAACLLITTSVLQFSSTILLSDLKVGPLIGNRVASEVRTSIPYTGDVEKISRDFAWTTNPPLFPPFGEYFEPPSEVETGIADTGVILRAFLPFADAKTRNSLAYYEGNALVLDARVSCQAPMLTKFNTTQSSALNLELVGVAAPSQKSEMLRNITATPFRCSVA